MDSLVNKVTLYDVISTTIPGAIVVFCMLGILPDEIGKLLINLNNAWFVFGIFILSSYCVGWVLSELSKFFKWILIDNNIYRANDKIKKLKWLQKFILFIYIIILLVFAILHFNKICILVFLFGILYGLCGCFQTLTKKLDRCKHKNSKEKEVTERDILYEICYNRMLTCYPESITYFEDMKDKTIEDRVKIFSNTAHFIIQAEPRYSRIHNYNSSKTFSKNLAGASLILTFTFSYLFLQNNGFNFDVIYACLAFLSIIASVILYQRLAFFEKKLEILILTYFIDYLEMKKTKKQSDQSDISMQNIKIQL